MKDAYREAGVDIDAAMDTKRSIRELVRSTFRPEVLTRLETLAQGSPAEILLQALERSGLEAPGEPAANLEDIARGWIGPGKGLGLGSDRGLGTTRGANRRATQITDIDDAALCGTFRAGRSGGIPTSTPPTRWTQEPSARAST